MHVKFVNLRIEQIHSLFYLLSCKQLWACYNFGMLNPSAFQMSNIRCIASVFWTYLSTGDGEAREEDEQEYLL